MAWSQLEKSKSLTATLDEGEANPSVGFECNICLDLVQDPVVTLCGHLYCWPCIYRWITSSDDLDHSQCPVCKAEVSEKTVIPLYGRGQTPNSSLSRLIPQRPASPRCSNNGTRVTSSHYSNNPFQQLHNRGYAPSPRESPSPLGNGGATHLADPMIGMFGEMIYARMFGNSETTLYAYPNSYHMAGSSSPRLRRHAVQTDKSLSRVCFFLFCCMMLCLILF